MTEIAITEIAGIHHLGLTVSDVERSARWYEEVLGFERIGALGDSAPNGRRSSCGTPGSAPAWVSYSTEARRSARSTKRSAVSTISRSRSRVAKNWRLGRPDWTASACRSRPSPTR